MLLRSCLFGILFALLPGLGQAGQSLTTCGKLPVVSSAQAICIARHYLEAKSAACVGKVKYDYAAELNGATWVVRTTPKGAQTVCTGDVLEIDQATGSLVRWESVKPDNPLIRYAL